MSWPSVSLKEAVELIEARIPRGRIVTATALSLMALVVMIACLIYIKDRAPRTTLPGGELTCRRSTN